MSSEATGAIAVPPRGVGAPAFVKALIFEAREDWPVFAIVAAYSVIAWLLCLTLGRLDAFKPLLYMPLSFGSMGTATGLYMVVMELPHAVLARPSSPLSALCARLKQRAHPRFLVSLALFAAACLFAGVFTCVKSLLNGLVPFRADLALARADAVLFFGADPWRLLQPLLDNRLAVRALQTFYVTGWLLALVGFLTAVSFSSRLRPLRLRFFTTYFASWIILGNVLAAAFMSAGPAFFAALTGDQHRYGGLFRALAFSQDMPNSSVMMQQALWDKYVTHHVDVGAGISAFPSLHVAMATLFALTAFKLSKPLGFVAALFASVIFIGSIALGWHYAVDGLVSAAFVLIVWFGMGRLIHKPAA